MLLLTGILVILAGNFVSRRIRRRGYQLLSNGEAARLSEGLRPLKNYSLIYMAIAMGLYLYLGIYSRFPIEQLTAAFFILLYICMVAEAGFKQLKLRKLQMPTDYRQRVASAEVIWLITSGWFAVTWIYDHPFR